MKQSISEADIKIVAIALPISIIAILSVIWIHKFREGRQRGE